MAFYNAPATWDPLHDQERQANILATARIVNRARQVIDPVGSARATAEQKYRDAVAVVSKSRESDFGRVDPPMTVDEQAQLTRATAFLRGDDGARPASDDNALLIAGAVAAGIILLLMLK
jgi:hypothetical protein